MKKMSNLIRWTLFLLCVTSSSLFAGSLRLYNDSPYKLRVVIRAADGTYLGEMIILPEHFMTWSSDYPSFGPSGSRSELNPTRSQTPYTVLWYCMDGGEYGISTNVAAGASVSAESSDGNRICKPPKSQNKKSPYGPNEQDEQLYNSEEYTEPGQAGDPDEQQGNAGVDVQSGAPNSSNSVNQ